jgi:inorganic phosphate transporter, PiT family
MDSTVLLFLTSGLFLGWALGANHLGNIFGTAIGTRMMTWLAAGIVCSIFVILGSVVSGAGAAETLGKLGSVNALGGSFMAALAAAITVYLMTKWGLPVSTTQAIVGGIIGWNLFSGSLTDTDTLTHILIGWVTGPMLAAVFAIALLKLIALCLHLMQPHLLRLDAYTRLGLIVAGAFGAYSLGANNIANVMGVFVPVSPFTAFSVAGFFTLSSVQQLFLVGSVAIAVGVLTYSHNVVHTVGSAVMQMSPVAAWVVVMAHSLVLFLFASEGLEQFLASHGLPTIPLVPVSSSEVVVGAVIGIGMLGGGRAVRWRAVGRIAAGWVTTPVIAAVLSFLGLFVLQNVFKQQVYRPVPYVLSEQALQRLESDGLQTAALRDLKDVPFETAREFAGALTARVNLGYEEERRIMSVARLEEITIDPARLTELESRGFTSGQMAALQALAGRVFPHRWMLAEALAERSADWRAAANTPNNKRLNHELRNKLEFIARTFSSH